VIGVTENLAIIRDLLKQATIDAGRDPDSVKLVAVSKKHPLSAILEAAAAGQRDFGENFVQEGIDKIENAGRDDLVWHFIGHLQSNKAKYAVRLFDLIHSVDSLKLARELDKQSRKINKIQEILIQVNISEEASKSGVNVKDTLRLLKDINRLENLSVKGLMTMPPYFNAPEKVRPYFAALRGLRDRLDQQGVLNVGLNELSMGMTGDFEVAIREGATLVRIGTAIFGKRE